MGEEDRLFLKAMQEYQKKTETSEIARWERSKLLIHLNKWLSAIEGRLNIAAAVLIMFIMLLTISEIIMRYVFNMPLSGYFEVVELVMAGAIFFGLAFTQRVGGNVRMELFIARVVKGRAYHLTECLTLLLALFVFAIITIYSLQSSFYDLKVGGTTYVLYLPTWPSKFCIPIGSFFLCLRFGIQIIQHSLQVVAGVEKREL